MQRVVAADLLIGVLAVPLVRFHEALLLPRYHEVDDHRGTAGNRGFRALIEVIHGLGAHKLELEVRMRVYAAGHYVLPARVDDPRATRYDEIAPHLPANRKRDLLVTA